MNWKINWKMATEPTLLKIFKNEIKKWAKNGRAHFLAPLQPWTLHLTADSTLSYHFSSSIHQPQTFLRSWLISLLIFISFFLGHSVVCMVNRMMWLPYGATTKRTDNAKAPFSNLKCQRWKMDGKWKHVKNAHPHHFLKK